jgi:hypothetical protein
MEVTLMPVQVIDASGKLLQIEVRGMLKKVDYDRIIQIAKEAIKREGKIRALITLEGFKGWERHGDWGDVSFMTEQGPTHREDGDCGRRKMARRNVGLYCQGISSHGRRVFRSVAPERSA